MIYEGILCKSMIESKTCWKKKDKTHDISRILSLFDAERERKKERESERARERAGIMDE